MSTRRDFLGTSSTLLAGALVASPDTALAAATQPPSSLPPAIRALRPMRDGVVPISVAERQGRLEKAKGLMRDQRIDALMLTGGTSMEYFTGIQWGLSERLLAAVIPVRGAAFLITPKFEEERAMEQAHLGPLGREAEVLAWEEHENPYDLLRSALASRGLSTATIAAEETVRFMFADGAAHVPGVTVVSGTPITAGCRMVKDAHELALMRHASAVTCSWRINSSATPARRECRWGSTLLYRMAARRRRWCARAAFC